MDPDNHILPELEIQTLQAYQNVSNAFDKTRYKIWPGTMQFLESINENADSTVRVLEVGCGNGKNLLHDFDSIEFEGVDICPNLVDICKSKGLKVQICDGCDLPYADNEFDHVFSVAVIHHVSSEERRLKFLSEMVRVCKPGGSIMFQVWATTSPRYPSSEIIGDDPHDRYVTFKISGCDTSTEEVEKRYYHFFDEDEFRNMISKVKTIDGKVYFQSDNYNFEGVVVK